MPCHRILEASRGNYGRPSAVAEEMSIFWVHAGNPERLKMSYFDIAKRVDMQSWDSPHVDIMQLVKDWFEGEVCGRWLFIVDNADNMEMLYGPGSSHLARYFPRSCHGSILMTTRYGKIGIKLVTAKYTISISALSSEESKQFLAARLGDVLSKDSDRRQRAEELEHIPLALVQASSFITENQVSIVRYLQLYRESDVSKMRLLHEHFDDDTRDYEIKNSVATTWVISFDYIRAHDPVAADILSLMSILDSQAIPESLLCIVNDPLALERSLGTLKAFTLVTLRAARDPVDHKQDRCYDLHRLVRLAMRNWLRMNHSFRSWTAKAFYMVSDQYDDGLIGT